MDEKITGDEVPIDLAGIYETGTPGFTKRAQGVLAGYIEAKNEETYGITTAESREIRESIKTAGSVREELLGIESAASYGDLSPLAKQTLKNVYSVVSDEINEMAVKKLSNIVKEFRVGEIEANLAIEAGSVLGDELAGIIETAEYDFGVRTEAHYTKGRPLDLIGLGSPNMKDVENELGTSGRGGTEPIIVNAFNVAYEAKNKIIGQQHARIISSPS